MKHCILWIAFYRKCLIVRVHELMAYYACQIYARNAVIVYCARKNSTETSRRHKLYEIYVTR